MQSAIEAMSAIPAGLAEAWNNGDATAFAADFAHDAEFVAFEGTVLHGPAEITAFHQPIFDTFLKGSRIVGSEVVFAREIEPGWGVVHNRLGVIMPGENAPLPSRDSMQLIVVRLRDNRWEAVALQNSRVLTLESQAVLDEFAARG
ncbi:MAG: SgcJ/EcaC family oxidoreductase [Actinoplanes sp.]